MIPPLTRLVILVTTSSVAPPSAMAFRPFLFQNQAADKSGYFVATKSGFARISSSTVLSNHINIAKQD